MVIPREGTRLMLTIINLNNSQKINQLNQLQLAYIAGFIDGDGCINGQIVKSNDYKRKFKLQLSVVFFQKSSRSWFINYLHNLLNMGYVRSRKDNMSELTIKNPKEVKILITKIIPFLIIKKPQANLILEIIDLLDGIKTDHDFLEVCKLIDKFIILNDSKKRTNTSEIVKKSLFPPVET